MSINHLNLLKFFRIMDSKNPLEKRHPGKNRMNENTLDRILKRIDSYRETVVSMQKTLTSIPAISPDYGFEGEGKKAEAVGAMLAGLGCDGLEEIPAPDPRVPGKSRPNWIASFNGRSDARTCWILSHMDVVPPGDPALWEADPYSVQVRDGRCIGRGVEDNHQGIISSLLAVKALREEGVTPACRVGLAVVSDEETGSKFGIDYVLKNRPGLFRPRDWIVIPDAGNADGTMIEVAEKSILWIECVTHGRQAHGSEPEKGINAHKAAAHFVVRMDSLYATYPKSDPVFEPPISTFEPTKKEANVPNINTIPGEDTVFFDCRILPEYDIGEVRKTVRGLADEIETRFGVRIELRYPHALPSPPATAEDAAVVLGLKRAIRDITGREGKPTGIGGGTVAAVFRSAGLPAACWQTIEDTAHSVNESCVIENVLTDAKVFAHLFLQAP
jgi:succinyl-diaminopimelate desuccinylase